MTPVLAGEQTVEFIGGEEETAEREAGGDMKMMESADPVRQSGVRVAGDGKTTSMPLRPD
jgi:hypothetical protein